jgi:outer membrane lipoprotein carrier protein
MRWVYTKPDLKELVINSLVYIQNAKTIFNSKLTIRFLSGIGKLKDDFQVNFSQPTATDEEGNYILDLVPKGFEAGIEKILLVVNKSNFQIMEFSLTDIYGNVTQIIFKNMKTNTKLLDTLFTFTPPPGVEIYDMRNK